MTTLAEITLQIAEKITNVVKGSATKAGSATSLTDVTRTEASGYFTEGVIWFLSGDNDGASTRIKNWDEAGKTFRFAAQSNSVSDEDEYAAIGREYPRERIIRAVNEALDEIGRTPTTDTSLAADGSVSYSLPAGVSELLRVDVDQGSDDEDWQEHRNWYVEGGTLYFDPPDFEPDSDEGTIRLTYLSDHSELSDDTDTLDRHIDDVWLAWAAAEILLEWRNDKRGGQDASVARRLEKATVMKQVMSKRDKRPHVIKTPHMAKW